MPRLRTVSPSTKGFTRRRAGKGWVFHDKAGQRITDPDEVQRIKSLAIPPAWRDVWISPYPNGHIQAVGTDDAGRRQYLYHPDWRVKRDKMKFDRVLVAARKLPAARRAIQRDLGLEGMPLERADAVAVRLLDLGYFRIGSDVYADTNGSFGLTTLEKRHVRRKGDVMRLLQVGQQRTWNDLDSAAVNTYLSSMFDDLTAKDFRTWHATVLAAAALAASDEPGDTKRSQQRAIKSAVQEVSEYLGNTPTIAKNSYIDPRVIDLYENGTTIDRAVVDKKYPSPAHKQRAIEKAVLDLLS
jgi:DNA topoisomerase-1